MLLELACSRVVQSLVMIRRWWVWIVAVSSSSENVMTVSRTGAVRLMSSFLGVDSAGQVSEDRNRGRNWKLLEKKIAENEHPATARADAPTGSRISSSAPRILARTAT